MIYQPRFLLIDLMDIISKPHWTFPLLTNLSAQAKGAMLMHPWPGNVRELENPIGRAVVLSPRSIQQPSDLGFGFDTSPTEVKLKFAKQAIDYDFVKKALTHNHGIVRRAARELGISRVNRYELIDKYGSKSSNLRIQKRTKILN